MSERPGFAASLDFETQISRFVATFDATVDAIDNGHDLATALKIGRLAELCFDLGYDPNTEKLAELREVSDQIGLDITATDVMRAISSATRELLEMRS